MLNVLFTFVCVLALGLSLIVAFAVSLPIHPAVRALYAVISAVLVGCGLFLALSKLGVIK